MMIVLLQRLSPRSLAGRLLLSIVLVLGLGLSGLTAVLKQQEFSAAQILIESQALQQAAALARMVAAAPPAAAATILQGYDSATGCAALSSNNPSFIGMSAGEAEFSRHLATMLNAPADAAPQVSIERLEVAQLDCATALLPGSIKSPTPEGDHHHGAGRHGAKVLQVTSVIPLSGQRWLTVANAVDLPRINIFSVASLLLIAAAVVGAVAYWAVRAHTKSLRLLAGAAERFGKGEHVPSLAESGPTDVAAAAKAFNTMQQRQADFIKDRMKMLAAIGHDLRTPLTTLRLKTEFIKDKAARLGLIATIEEMVVITEATLAFTRAEANTEPTKMADLRQLLEEIRSECAASGHEVLLAEGPAITYACRPVGLKRALRNLIENAVRYGGAATVVLAIDSKAITLTVDDNGSGIPPDQLAHVFEPFVRLETSRNAETGGIGMGLAITRSIIKAHGGTITLSNRAEGGLRATVTLPA